MSFSEGQAALTEGLSTDGLSMEEVRLKEEEERQAKLKKLEELQGQAEAGGNAAGSKPKKSTEADEAGEIDVEDEVMYAQAVQEQQQEEDDDDHDDSQKMANPAISAAAAAALSDPHKRLLIQVPVSPVSNQLMPPPPPPQKRRKLSAAALEGANQTKPSAKAASAHKGKSMSASPTAGVRDCSPAASGSVSETSTTTMPLVDHKTWGQCISILALKFGDATAGDLFKTPDTLQKENQNAKWNAEAVKQKPWLLHLEKALSGDAAVKLTDQSFKSAITSAKKVNAKVDKKLEYETESNSQKLFSVRTTKLRTVLEAVKDLRSSVFSSLKQSNLDPESLRIAIEKVQTPFQELNDGKLVGFPEHWVQALVFSLN